MNLDWVRLMRFTYVKQTVAWRDIQSEAGGPFDFSRVGALLDEIEARDLEMVARLGGTPDWAMRGASDPSAHDTPPEDVTLFGAYCGALAEQFAGRIRAYQIWNEPNLGREWGGFAPNAADTPNCWRHAARRSARPIPMRSLFGGLSPGNTTCRRGGTISTCKTCTTRGFSGISTWSGRMQQATMHRKSDRTMQSQKAATAG